MTSPTDASALEAKINTLQAELTSEREARIKAEQEVKELRDAMDDGEMPEEAAAKIAELEDKVATLVQVREAEQEEARMVLVEETKAEAPEGFEVDADAPTEVLVAQLKAFRAAKQAAPKTGGKKTPVVRLHAAKAEESVGGDKTDVYRILASSVRHGKELPLAFRRNGAAGMKKEDA